MSPCRRVGAPAIGFPRRLPPGGSFFICLLIETILNNPNYDRGRQVVRTSPIIRGCDCIRLLLESRVKNCYDCVKPPDSSRLRGNLESNGLAVGLKNETGPARRGADERPFERKFGLIDVNVS